MEIGDVQYLLLPLALVNQDCDPRAREPSISTFGRQTFGRMTQYLLLQ